MNSIRSAIENTISISLFNRGLAGKIFDDVKAHGAKVVMKNNAPECVLLSPDEYIRLLDEANDARLLNAATERMSHYNPSTLANRSRWIRSLDFPQQTMKTRVISASNEMGYSLSSRSTG